MLTGFRWLVEDRLAGSGCPGLLAPMSSDLEFIESKGIKLILTLTETPLQVPEEDCQRLGIQLHHFAIPDMGFPQPRVAQEACDLVLSAMEDGAVLLHCRAGLGRTGMIGACCLVSMGETPENALRMIRSANPLYVQTSGQEGFIENYGRFLAAVNS